MTDDILHVYAQEWWNDPVQIVGTRSALEKLSSCIARALESGQARISVYASDAEEYDIIIRAEEADTIARLDLPYTDPVAREDTE